MYLLDTDIVTELRKAKSGQTDRGLINWASGVSRQNLFISALSLLELETGVTQLERRDKVAGQSLRTWLDEQVLKAFEGHILPIDAAIVKKRAHLPMNDSRDALLAATASVHGLTIVTRDVTAFRSGRVKVFNPWGYTPDVTEDNADWRQVAKSGPLWFKNLFLRF